MLAVVAVVAVLLKSHSNLPIKASKCTRYSSTLQLLLLLLYTIC